MSKIKTYESEALAKSYTYLMQVLDKINKLMEEHKVDDVAKLPNSVLSTKSLFEVAICYDILYNAAVDNSLISSGHHKTHKLTH